MDELETESFVYTFKLNNYDWLDCINDLDSAFTGRNILEYLLHNSLMLNLLPKLDISHITNDRINITSLAKDVVMDAEDIIDEFSIIQDKLNDCLANIRFIDDVIIDDINDSIIELGLEYRKLVRTTVEVLGTSEMDTTLNVVIRMFFVI